MAVLLAALMLVISLPTTVIAESAVNEEGYIEVYTIEDLYNIRDDLTANYILMNDINLTAATAKGGDWDFMGNGWNPIGSDDIYGNLAFSGEFNGNGKRIIGMRIDGTTMPSGVGIKYVGLFANITGSVHDLTLESTNITWPQAGGGYIGSVAGMNNGSIYNISADVTITLNKGTSNCVGGIVGRSQGTVSRCSTAGSIKYTYSYSSGSTHTSGVGGIVGYATGGTIEECYNTASLMQENTSSGSEGFVGGICGRAYYYSALSGSTPVTIKNCYNTGDVRSSHNYCVAGILGESEGPTSSKHTITNCYNIGKCLTTLGSANSGAYGIVDVVNGSNITISNCYYLQGTGKSNTGATSLTAGQLKLQSSYSSFDFDSIWVMDANAMYPYPQLKNNAQDLRVVESVILASKPTKAEYKFGEEIDLTGASLQIEYTNGTSELIDITKDMLSGYSSTTPGVQSVSVTYKGFTNSFTVKVNEKAFVPIYTIADLYNIRDDLTANYILMNDIDLTEATAKGGDWDYDGRGWNPIGSDDVYSNSAFTGEFDGNGHSIIGMRIVVNGDDGVGTSRYVGLFANNKGEISNLSIESVYVNIYDTSMNTTWYSGAICGTNSGEITNCSVSGEILEGTTVYSNSDYFGGITGFNSGNIVGCFNIADLKYARYLGGIAGYNTGNISDCYNIGKVSDSLNKAGGIAGENSGTINTCYNTGIVTGDKKYAISNIGCNNSYYLVNSGSGATNCVSLSAAQMKATASFRGFDFDNVWVLNEFANHPYPQLKNNIQDMSESASLVSIIALPLKTEYMTGDALDFTGAMVKVIYVSGKEEIIDITNDIVSGFDMNTVGEQTVTVTVAGACDTYTINVKERPIVSGVEITSEPTVKQFAVGTAFDFSGAQATVSYEGGIVEVVDITPDMTTGGDINHIGKQTVTVTFGEKSAIFDIEVVGIILESIEITTLPTKINYLEGQSLELDGMTVTAIMNNGIKNTVATGYTVSGYYDEPGEHTVTVEYFGKTATFDVIVAERTLVSIALNSLPDKLEYISGQEFDATGMQVIATYDNGDVEVSENYTVSGLDTVPGIKNVVVTLDGKSISFTVKVVARVITEFKLASLPSKLSYIEYEKFDSTGLMAQVTYNDGITEEVTNYTVSGFSSNVGTHTVSVAYEGFVESFDITVIPRELENIRLSSPDKLNYEIGEVFDTTGLVVTACYNNGQEITVDDYQISGFDSASAGAKTVTVTYGGISRSFAVVVAERSQIETGGHIIVGNVVGRLGETVNVPVSITKNTGIAGFEHTVTFDTSKFRFVSAVAVDEFASGTVVVNDEKAADGEVTVLWFGTGDITGDGTVYNLAFEILETASDGSSEIAVSFDSNDNANVSGENVLFEAVNGSIEVLSYWLGDLNGDRVYAMADLLQLAQYVSGKEMTLTEKQKLSADVNEDGIIDIHDVVMLQQWLLVADM